MKTEIRDRWTAALRSGQYEQGRTKLKTEDGRFCCLGVLCDVLGVNLDEVRPEGDYRWGAAGGVGIAPPVLESLLDLRTREDLADLNDRGVPFLEIADEIENTVGVTE